MNKIAKEQFRKDFWAFMSKYGIIKDDDVIQIIKKEQTIVLDERHQIVLVTIERKVANQEQ